MDVSTAFQDQTVWEQLEVKTCVNKVNAAENLGYNMLFQETR